MSKKKCMVCDRQYKGYMMALNKLELRKYLPIWNRFGRDICKPCRDWLIERNFPKSKSKAKVIKMRKDMIRKGED